MTCVAKTAITETTNYNDIHEILLTPSATTFEIDKYRTLTTMVSEHGRNLE